MYTALFSANYYRAFCMYTKAGRELNVLYGYIGILRFAGFVIIKRKGIPRIRLKFIIIKLGSV